MLDKGSVELAELAELRIPPWVQSPTTGTAIGTGGRFLPRLAFVEHENHACVLAWSAVSHPLSARAGRPTHVGRLAAVDGQRTRVSISESRACDLETTGANTVVTMGVLTLGGGKQPRHDISTSRSTVANAGRCRSRRASLPK